MLQWDCTATVHTCPSHNGFLLQTGSEKSAVWVACGGTFHRRGEWLLRGLQGGGPDRLSTEAAVLIQADLGRGSEQAGGRQDKGCGLSPRGSHILVVEGSGLWPGEDPASRAVTMAT